MKIRVFIGRVVDVRPLLLAVALLLAGGLSHAAPRGRVARVKQLFDQLFFKEAAATCQAALDAGRNSRAELLQLFGYKALIAASQGQEAAAIEAFKRVLAIDVRTKLERGYAPRIRRAFEAASRWMARRAPITLSARAPPSASRGAQLRIGLEVIADPLAMIEHGVLHLRVAGAEGTAVKAAAGFTAQERRPRRQLGWVVALSALSGIGAAAVVEYYVTALDKDFNTVAEAGTAKAPQRVLLRGAPPFVPRPPVVAAGTTPPDQPRRESSSLLGRWWFWTAIGAVVAVATGVGVGVGVGTRSPADRVNAPVTLEIRK